LTEPHALPRHPEDRIGTATALGGFAEVLR
jgi:hypothetical protein